MCLYPIKSQNGLMFSKERAYWYCKGFISVIDLEFSCIYDFTIMAGRPLHSWKITSFTHYAIFGIHCSI